MYLGLSALAVVLILGLAGYTVYGSPFALVAMARGEVVMAEPRIVDVEGLQVGRRQLVMSRLSNLSSRTVTVNGLQSSCTCIAADSLPMELPARECRPLRIWVRPPLDSGGKPFEQAVGLYLSVPAPHVAITVRGMVSQKVATP